MTTPEEKPEPDDLTVAYMCGFAHGVEKMEAEVKVLRNLVEKLEAQRQRIVTLFDGMQEQLAEKKP